MTAQSSNEGGPVIFLLIELLILAVVVAGLWKVFVKAGQPGWAAVVPIYNLIVLLNIARKPLWWIVLCVIPFVNLIAAILISIAVARNFGKSVAFGVGLALLPFVFYPMLGFSDAIYQPGVDDRQGFPVGVPS